MTVFAAASLKDSFTEIGRRYEKSHEGVRLSLNFAGSQTLAAQIVHGAPADIFASASIKNLMDSKPDTASIRTFAHNRLTLVFRKGYAGGKRVKDLSSVPKLVLADPSVPAGRYAEELLNSAAKLFGRAWRTSVERRIVSRELDVRSVLTKVRLGEADGGIVYVSDAISAKGLVQAASIPASINPPVKYPIGLTASSTNKDAAKGFLKFIFTPEAQTILERNGFISPIRPVTKIEIVRGAKTRNVVVPFPPSLHLVSIEVLGHDDKPESARGVSVASAIGSHKGTVKFIAADDYAQTFPAKDLISGRAVLVRENDGNYQVVVKGHPPKAWVRWIRRIELK
ncbi:MAG: molybdate ABC transporter substrate-binding protein [Fimbriimonadaceae bacterium]